MAMNHFAKWVKFFLFGGLIIFLGFCHPEFPVWGAAKITDPTLARGMDLYRKHCSACHGETGKGDGEAEYLLWPKPRNFSGGNFRLTSVESGLPLESDIVSTLKIGMAGSAMPSWGHFPDSDLKALAVAVRNLALEGKIAQLMLEDADLSRAKALEIAKSVFAPGPPVEIPPEVSPDPKLLKTGKELYGSTCAKCHDLDGRGRLKTDMVTNEGDRIFSRDFTQGVFKGGVSGIDLARRVKRGMPGTPHPAFPDYSPEQLWAIVHFVRGFIKPNAQERVLQKQTTFVAQRVEKEIISNPTHPAWGNFRSVFVPVMPLWWRHERIEGCELQAVHDGKRLAVRLVWDDPHPDDGGLDQRGFTDGAALQFSESSEPPLFAMGAKNEEVTIWHWKASWENDPGDRSEIRRFHPNMPSEPHNFGAPDETLYQAAEFAGNPLSQRFHASPVENLAAAGFGTLTNLGEKAQDIEGRSTWSNGKWHVLFWGDLKGKLKAASVEPISIALAMWDGSAGDRNGQKSVTIWHKLLIGNRSAD